MRGDGDPEGYKKGGHDKPFVPAKVVREKVKAAYEHQSDRMEIKKNFRSEEGEVLVGPKNFLTNPCESGKFYKNTTFNGIQKYEPDQYDAAHEIALKELEYHKSKLQDKPFSQRAKSQFKHLFNADQKVFGEDVAIPARAEKKHEVHSYPHDKPFFPSNPNQRFSIHKTIGKFPEYKEDPPKEISKRQPDDPDAPKKFKPTHTGKSVPQPSVAVNIRNLKASFPTVFRR